MFLLNRGKNIIFLNEGNETIHIKQMRKWKRINSFYLSQTKE